MSTTPAVRTDGHPRPAPQRPLKVFYWPADALDGCQLYRCRIPADELNRIGHEARMSQRMDDWGRYEADIVVGQRIAPTRPSIGWQLMCQRAKKAGHRRMVYEVDDDLFNIDPKTNPHGQAFHDPTMRANMIDNIRASDLVTVTTEPLADVLRSYNPNVVVIPNAVRGEVFDVPLPDRRGKAGMPGGAAGPVVYGWQGSDTHGEDWLVAEPAVQELLTTSDDTYLRFLGTPYWARLHAAGVPAHRMGLRGWTPDIMAHYKRVARFDVSLAPLTGSVFNRSKSGLRVQESLALGVPAVASDVPAYRDWVEDGHTGFLVRGKDEWLEAMRALADPVLRLEMGDAGREAARAWTIEATIEKWVDAYRSLLD